MVTGCPWPQGSRTGEFTVSHGSPGIPPSRLLRERLTPALNNVGVLRFKSPRRIRDFSVVTLVPVGPPFAAPRVPAPQIPTLAESKSPASPFARGCTAVARATHPGYLHYSEHPHASSCMAPGRRPLMKLHRAPALVVLLACLACALPGAKAVGSGARALSGPSLLCFEPSQQCFLKLQPLNNFPCMTCMYRSLVSVFLQAPSPSLTPFDDPPPQPPLHLAPRPLRR